MKKSEFVNMVHERSGKGLGLTKTGTDEFIRDVFACIADVMLQEDEVSIPNFGKFYTKTRKEREGRNPVTEQIEVFPEVRIPKMKPSGNLRDRIKAWDEKED